MEEVLELILELKRDLSRRHLDFQDITEAQHCAGIDYKMQSAENDYCDFLNNAEVGLLDCIDGTHVNKLEALAHRYHHPTKAPPEELAEIVKDIFVEVSLLESAYRALDRKDRGIRADDTKDYLQSLRETVDKYLGKINASITGIGKCLPETNVTNYELEAMLETSNDWIIERSAITGRRVSSKKEDNVYMAVQSAILALKDAGLIREYQEDGQVKYEQLVNKGRPVVDKIMVITNHHKDGSNYPSLPGAVQNRLIDLGINVEGIESVPHGIGCEGFGHIVGDAQTLVESGEYSRILAVSSENITDFDDWLDRSISVLLGSGAGAYVIENTAEPGLHAYNAISEGEYYDPESDEKPALFAGPARDKEWVQNIEETRDRLLHGLLPKWLLSLLGVDPAGDSRKWEAVVDDFFNAVKKQDSGNLYLGIMEAYGNEKLTRIPGITMQKLDVEPAAVGEKGRRLLERLGMELPEKRPYATAAIDFVDRIISLEDTTIARQSLLKGAVPDIILESYGVDPTGPGRDYETVLNDFLHAAKNRDITCVMDGKRVFEWAVEAVPRVVNEMFEKYQYKIPYTLDDIDWFIPHQANGRMIPQIARSLGIPMEKIYIDMSYGNTSCSSVPITLDNMKKKGLLKDGQKIVVSAFGAGLGTTAYAFTYRENHNYLDRDYRLAA